MLLFIDKYSADRDARHIHQLYGYLGAHSMNTYTTYPTGYYVYAYLRRDDYTPYYIGKGKIRRAWQKHKNISIPSNLYLIKILESNLTELGAFALERRYIRWYGRIDLGTGILRNLTDGGEGQAGRKQTLESNAKRSATQTGRERPLDVRIKIGLAHKGKPSPHKGKKLGPSPLRGRARSPDFGEHIRSLQLGKKRPPEVGENIRRAKALAKQKRLEKDII